ncbi:hypothetical protein GW17_00043435 [Ensete ventricosum]|nr:hypothetical protein GW17_00043435 [Ensete ventricosum]
MIQAIVPYIPQLTQPPSLQPLPGHYPRESNLSHASVEQRASMDSPRTQPLAYRRPDETTRNH